MKAHKDLETYKSVLIILPADCDRAEATGRRIYAQLVERRHADCRKIERFAVRTAVVLAAINLFLCAVIWSLLSEM